MQPTSNAHETVAGEQQSPESEPVAYSKKTSSMAKVTGVVSLLLILIMTPFCWYLYTDYAESEKVRLELEEVQQKELKRENARNYIKMDQVGIDYINDVVLKDVKKDSAFGTRKVPPYTKEEAEGILGFEIE